MKKIFCITVLFLFFPLVTQAAEISLYTKNNPVGYGQNFQVDLVLDSEGQTLNAVQGTVHFNQQDLILKDIYYGDTLVVFWVDKPAIKNNSISFSGIIPGGYLGIDGKILSLIFYSQTQLISSSKIDLDDVEVLLNDGKGTSVSTKINSLNLVFSSEVNNTSTILENLHDEFSPEPFALEIIKNPEIYDNKYFVVFDTQDKNSGLERYEILETKTAIYDKETSTWLPPEITTWTIASSPYVLEDQSLNSFIFVRAIDKASNVRLSYFAPENVKTWYNYKYLITYVVGGLLLVSTIGFFYVKYKKKNK